MEKRYFQVTAKCGHVGNRKYIAIDFPVIAINEAQAASIALDIPRVKHDQKSAILNIKEITRVRFYQLARQNKNDPYLCLTKNDKEVRREISPRIEKYVASNYKRSDSEASRFYKLKKRKLLEYPYF